MSGRTTPLPAPAPLPSNGGAAGSDAVTLTMQRVSPRAVNEYVETPLRSPIRTPSIRNSPLVAVHRATSLKRPTAIVAPTPIPPTTTSAITKHPVSAITKQPASFTKIPHPSTPAPNDKCVRTSIICQRCGLCRCDACRRPRSLPAVWLCDGACLCSAQSVLDYATCVCCVKAAFYHCARDHEEDREGTDCADKPCSCAPHRRCARWGIMTLMSLVLPCLCCYWPLRTCTKGIESAYQRCNSNGCRCNDSNGHSGIGRGDAQDKRLLDASPET